MDAQLARLFLTVDGLDDAAWTVVAAAASGVDEDRLAAVLAGRAGTATLPDHAALRALARLDDAQIPAALHGEQRTSVLDVAANPYSLGVTLTPRFMAGGQPRPQLLIGPGLTQMRGFDGAGSSQGALQAGSGIQLAFGSQGATIAIDSTTGLVSVP